MNSINETPALLIFFIVPAMFLITCFTVSWIISLVCDLLVKVYVWFKKCVVIVNKHSKSTIYEKKNN